MSDFTPVSAVVGGALIGVSVAALWILNGRAAGISGIAADLLLASDKERSWRAWFVAGLLAGGLAIGRLFPGRFSWSSPPSVLLLVIAGVLVGFGTRLSGGCTSGHGLCGVSRLSRRSMVATGVFMALGMASVYAARHLLGGAA